MTTTFLFEIGCEELPSSSLEQLSYALVSGFESVLQTENVQFACMRAIAAPRRIGVLIQELADTTEPRAIAKRGPAVSQAYQDGRPTGALIGFCKGLGIPPEAISVEETDKGAWVAYHSIQPGQPIAELLPRITHQVVSQLPMTKPMRWGSGRALFPRPVHWIVALLGKDVVPFELFDLNTDRVSYGHRVHSPSALMLHHADEYFDTLKQHRVLPDFEERKAFAWAKIQEVARLHQIIVDEDIGLLREITCLVEWPVPMLGEFEEAFLQVPDIALVAAMRGHQKYFHTRRADGTLSNQFITVANIESIDPAQVISGNQRVIRARLSDARFFYETDRQSSLDSRRSALDRIAFQPGLGSLGDKTERIRILAKEMASQLKVDPAQADRAALLSRCDLVSEMVLEFDELQGQMGAIYALADGETSDVADAIESLYRPSGPTDRSPQSLLGCILGLSDRLDTLAGLFSIGQPPTGSKDPFGLRRAMLAVIRINMEPGLALDLAPWIKRALDLQPVEVDSHVFDQLIQFLRDRERGLLLELGIPHDLIAAAQGTDDTNSHLTAQRAKALLAFRTHAAFAPLIASNKRIVNILAKSDTQLGSVNEALMTEASEFTLVKLIQAITPRINDAVSRETYESALEIASSFTPALDAFFDQVLVNDPNDDVRQNRYSILRDVQSALLPLGDLSQVQA